MSDSPDAAVTPSTGLALVTLVVRDYDEAIAWYTKCLPFTLLEDTPIGDGKRWVRITAPGNGAALLLAKAAGDAQIAAIGNQTGGRVAFFLTVPNFAEAVTHMKRCGVIFEGEARNEPYGNVIVFQDLYGNRWDLLGPQSNNHSA